jgi:hypothetical protein
MKNDELDRVINALRPAMADELTDAACERRPGPALVRARAGAPTPLGARRPARRLPITVGAAALATTTAVVTAVALSGGHQGTGGTVPRTGGTADTRAFLLASAEIAGKRPATHGTCWYSRTRMWQDIAPPRGKHGAHVPLSADAPRLDFQARTASSTEQWDCALPGGGTGMRFRTRLPLDVDVTFPTKKDEAAWRAAGSPPLGVNGGTTATKPFTTTYDKGSHLVNPDIGSHEIEWKTLPGLSATESGLERYLRRLWQEDRAGGAYGYTASADFGEYVFVSAWDLFMAPTTPGTRAALYRVLANCPTVHVTGRVTDREGRRGVAITVRGTDVRLVVDPVTAQLLDFQEGTTGGDYLAFERQGWVDRIGAVPAT